MKNLPPIIQEVGFDFTWSVQKVWKLDATSEDVPIDTLNWHFDVPFLGTTPKNHYNLTPRAVMEHPEQYAEEYARTMQADLRYPIDVMFWKGRWVILDGLHRLMRASIEGKKTVRVRKIPASAIPLIRK